MRALRPRGNQRVDEALAVLGEQIGNSLARGVLLVVFEKERRHAGGGHYIGSFGDVYRTDVLVAAHDLTREFADDGADG